MTEPMTPADHKPTHVWNGIDGHNCEDCEPDSMWKCDIFAHGGQPTDHGIIIATKAEQRRDAEAFVGRLPMRPTTNKPMTPAEALAEAMGFLPWANKNWLAQDARVVLNLLGAGGWTLTDGKSAERSETDSEMAALRKALRDTERDAAQTIALIVEAAGGIVRVPRSIAVASDFEVFVKDDATGEYWRIYETRALLAKSAEPSEADSEVAALKRQFGVSMKAALSREAALREALRRTIRQPDASGRWLCVECKAEEGTYHLSECSLKALLAKSAEPSEADRSAEDKENQ